MANNIDFDAEFESQNMKPDAGGGEVITAAWGRQIADNTGYLYYNRFLGNAHISQWTAGGREERHQDRVAVIPFVFEAGMKRLSGQFWNRLQWDSTTNGSYLGERRIMIGRAGLGTLIAGETATAIGSSVLAGNLQWEALGEWEYTFPESGPNQGTVGAVWCVAAVDAGSLFTVTTSEARTRLDVSAFVHWA